ncbi:MAG: hypothetical protein WAO19_11115, partial [Candidatus Kryptoniota bacterium]
MIDNLVSWQFRTPIFFYPRHSLSSISSQPRINIQHRKLALAVKVGGVQRHHWIPTSTFTT